MSIGATILMLVFFPLNSLLLFGQGVISGNDVQAKVLNKEEKGISQGLVRGAEAKKEETLE